MLMSQRHTQASLQDSILVRIEEPVSQPLRARMKASTGPVIAGSPVVVTRCRAMAHRRNDPA
jgi:uncharacterized protein YggT (Ycf19 family)